MQESVIVVTAIIAVAAVLIANFKYKVSTPPGNYSARRLMQDGNLCAVREATGPDPKTVFLLVTEGKESLKRSDNDEEASTPS